MAAGVTDTSTIMKQATIDYHALKDDDPLVNWFKKGAKDSSPTIDRIQTFAANVANLMKFSLLIDPGHLRPHLSVGCFCHCRINLC